MSPRKKATTTKRSKPAKKTGLVTEQPEILNVPFPDALEKAQKQAFNVPYGFEPRKYQLPIFQAFSSGFKRFILVDHRRWGKDTVSLNITIKEMFQRVGVYYHVFPFYTQGRKILWDGIDKTGKKFLDYFPPDAIKSINHQQMKIELVNGSVWQIIGADNINSIVGTNPIGIVFSEYSLMNPAAWDFLRPILAENGGWALFVFTPRGENHAYKEYQYALSRPSEWFVQMQTVYESKAVAEDIIESERQACIFKYGNDSLWRQEWLCDFKVPIPGAYYAPQIRRAYDTGRIGHFPHIATLPVGTAWDIGISDSDATAIWFFQFVENKIHIIDYADFENKGLPEIYTEIKKKPYIYSADFQIAPHDIRNREWGNGKRRDEVAQNLGLNFKIAPKLPVIDGIDACRDIFEKCCFNEAMVEKGLNGLKNYRKAFNETTNNFTDKPLHDWTSHPADAFRMMAITVSEADIYSAVTKKQQRYDVQRDIDSGYGFNPDTV